MLLDIKNTFNHFFSRMRLFIANNPRWSAALAALLIANGIILKIVLVYGWDPQDYGGFLGAAWRILQGQKPYVDFYFHVGPMLLYILAAFIGLFGFTKFALWASVMFDSTLAALFVFAGGKTIRLPTSFCFAATLLTLAGFHWGNAFPRYDHYAPFWSICSIWLMAAHACSASAKQSFWQTFGAGLFAVFAIATKLPDGIAAFTSLLVAIAILPHQRAAAFKGYFCGMLTACGIVLLMIPDLAAFVQQTFIDYNSSQMNRLSRFTDISFLSAHGYWLPPFIVIAILGKRVMKVYFWVYLTAAVFATALFAYIVGSERNPATIPLMGTACLLAIAAVWRGFATETDRLLLQKRNIGLLAIGLFALTHLFSCVSFSISSRQSDCKHHHYGKCYEYTMTTKPLDGWKVYKNWGHALDTLVPFINQNVGKERTLMYLSDFQIIDLILKRKPYTGIPFQFVWEISPASGQARQRVYNSIVSNPPDWILTYKDDGPFRINLMLVYMALENFLLENYIPVFGDAGYFLTRRITQGDKVETSPN